MTVVSRVLVQPLQIASAATTQYTTPANTRTIIDKMTATNTTGAAVTFTLFLVPAAGAAGVGTTIISAQSIAAGATYLCPEGVGHTLNPGDLISTSASAATAITLRVSGREVS